MAAARHALSRLAYGPRPGEAEALARSGLRAWLEAQIDSIADGASWAPASVNELPYLNWRPEDLVAEFAARPTLRKRAIARGLVDPQDLDGSNGVLRQRDAEATLESLENQRGVGMQDSSEAAWHPVTVLRQQRIIRGLASQTQLHEVLLDFWFNHFNVSANKEMVTPHLVPYERDAIRANMAGSFLRLLESTASHAAMLHYLDNGSSRAPRERETTFDRAMGGGARGPLADGKLQLAVANAVRWRDLPARRRLEPTYAERDINENYARELLELHTLGVDGGYSAYDIVEVARAFTGWSYPPTHGPKREQLLQFLEQDEAMAELGFVRRDEFLFRPDWHDAEPKQVLGYALEGHGIEDGRLVLTILSTHPSTARHLAWKLSRHFVSPTPPESLVRRLEAKFLQTRGDLEEVLRALIWSEEFWQTHPIPLRKSPLEYVLSAARALDALPILPGSARDAWLVRALEGMGQPLYRYDPPTGFPPIDETWFSPGALLARVNFVSRLVNDRIGELDIDWQRIGAEDEYENLEQALDRALHLLQPQHDATTRESLLSAMKENTVPRRLWFRTAVFMILCAPEFHRK